MERRSLLAGLVIPAVLVLLADVRPIMAQPIGPRGAPLVSPPGFVGPGPSCKAEVRLGWSYYGLPNGPTTTLTDYRVGVWNWGWSGYPAVGDRVITKGLSLYGPPVPSYTPVPSVFGSDARKHYMDPPVFGYGLNSLGYRSASPRLKTPSVSVQPTRGADQPR